MTNSRTILRRLARTMLVAGAALLLNVPADAGDAARTRRSSAQRVAPRTQVTGQVGTRIRTGRTGRHYRPYRYGYGFYYGPWRYGYGYRWSVWPGAYVHGYYGYPAYPHGPRASSDARQPYGAFDLDVRPRTTEIYVDGEYVGLARNFDGWPDVLWLEPGAYDVSFYRDGYQTVTRRLTVTEDAVVEVRERLQKGESVRPEPPPAAEPRAGAAPAAEGTATVETERDDAGGAVVTFPRRSAGDDR